MKNASEIDWDLAVSLKRDEMLADLMTLLAIPSVRDEATADPDAPCGQAVAQALDYMLKLARSHGLHTEKLEGIVGYASFGGGELGNTDEQSASDDGDTGSANDPASFGDRATYDTYDQSADEGYIAVLTHLDVVPPGDGWTSPPFEPQIRGGRLYARGAIDDKGPAMASLYALLAVKSLGLPLRRQVRLIWGTDEESGMACMDVYNRLQPPPVAGFTPDADFPIVHAEKGQVNARMTLLPTRDYPSDASLRFVSFRSGRASNMVPDEAEAVISGPTARLSDIADKYDTYLQTETGGTAEFVPASKGEPESESEFESAKLVLRLQGRSVHGMVPHEGVNAGLRLLHFLRDFEWSGSGSAFVRDIDSLLYEDFEGQALGIAGSDAITGSLTVNAGLFAFDSAPDQAYVHLNIRHPISMEGDRIVTCLNERLSAIDWKLEQVSLKRPHAVPADHPLVTTLQRVYREQTGQAATLLSTGGGTYAAKLASGVAFGPLFPGEFDSAHQSDESIALDSLMKATAIYARAIYELANTNNMNDQQIG